MGRCASCGTALNPGSAFCGRCGTAVPTDPAITVPTATAGTPAGHPDVPNGPSMSLPPLDSSTPAGRSGLVVAFVLAGVAIVVLTAAIVVVVATRRGTTTTADGATGTTTAAAAQPSAVPRVRIVTPVNGESQLEGPLAVRIAYEGDPSKVKLLALEVDGQGTSTVNRTDQELTALVGRGNHELRVRVLLNDGDEVLSAPVSLTVNSTTVPPAPTPTPAPTPAPAPSPRAVATVPGLIYGTCPPAPCGLARRNAPSESAKIGGPGYDNGEVVAIACDTSGGFIDTGDHSRSTTRWFRLGDGLYVPDLYVMTEAFVPTC